MNIDYAKSFDNQFRKLSELNKGLVRGTIEIFIDDPFNDSLRNHPLKKQWIGYRSISVTDDLRIHYRLIDKNTALLVAVGSHSELYK